MVLIYHRNKHVNDKSLTTTNEQLFQGRVICSFMQIAVHIPISMVTNYKEINQDTVIECLICIYFSTTDLFLLIFQSYLRIFVWDFMTGTHYRNLTCILWQYMFLNNMSFSKSPKVRVWNIFQRFKVKWRNTENFVSKTGNGYYLRLIVWWWDCVFWAGALTLDQMSMCSNEIFFPKSPFLWRFM